MHVDLILEILRELSSTLEGVKTEISGARKYTSSSNDLVNHTLKDINKLLRSVDNDTIKKITDPEILKRLKESREILKSVIKEVNDRFEYARSSNGFILHTLKDTDKLLQRMESDVKKRITNHGDKN